MTPPRERIFNVPGAVLALVVLLTGLHLLLAFTLTVRQTNELLALFSFNPLRYGSTILPGQILPWICDIFPNWWGPQLWSFVSYAFLHADLNHLIFNLLWLLAFGAPIARRFGTVRFLAFCGATAAAGALTHLAAHWGECAPVIGASAAVSGTMAGAMRFVFQRNAPLGLLGSGEQESYSVPAASLSAMLRDFRILAFLAVWFGINLLFGLGAIEMPGQEGAVAWEAHIGGFLAGLLGFGLFDPVRPGTPVEGPISTDEQAPPDKPA